MATALTDVEDGQEAWRLATKSPGRGAFLSISLAECESCDHLHSDMNEIANRLDGVRLLSIKMDGRRPDHVGLLNVLKTSEFPTIYYFRAGQLRTGWVGYKRARSRKQTLAGLLKLMTEAMDADD